MFVSCLLASPNIPAWSHLDRVIAQSPPPVPLSFFFFIYTCLVFNICLGDARDEIAGFKSVYLSVCVGIKLPSVPRFLYSSVPLMNVIWPPAVMNHPVFFFQALSLRLMKEQNNGKSVSRRDSLCVVVHSSLKLSKQWHLLRIPPCRVHGRCFSCRRDARVWFREHHVLSVASDIC